MSITSRLFAQSVAPRSKAFHAEKNAPKSSCGKPKPKGARSSPRLGNKNSEKVVIALYAWIYTGSHHHPSDFIIGGAPQHRSIYRPVDVVARNKGKALAGVLVRRVHNVAEPSSPDLFLGVVDCPDL